MGWSWNLGRRTTTTAQQVNYLGFKIDTVTMTVSVIPAKAAGFLLVLKAAMDTLRTGGDVSYSDWNHIASKLEDYAQVSQLGKSYVAWAWSYLTYGPTLSEYGRSKLIVYGWPSIPPFFSPAQDITWHRDYL